LPNSNPLAGDATPMFEAQPAGFSRLSCGTKGFQIFSGFSHQKNIAQNREIVAKNREFVRNVDSNFFTKIS